MAAEYSFPEWFLFVALNVKALFSVIFNLFIIYVIRKRKANSVTFILIANQAACDAICCIVFPLTWYTCSANFSGQARWAKLICESFTTIKMASFTISVLTMTAIAIERYIKLYYPHSKRSLNAKAAILVTWTLAILLTVVQMQNLRIAQYFTEHKLIGCMNAFSESSEVPFFHHHYNYPLAVILGGVVPLVVIVVTYTLVIGRLRERNRSVSFKSDIRSHEKEKTSRKTIRMLIIMVVVYVILITPNTLLTITDYFFADLTKGCSTSTMKPSYFRFFYYMAQVSTCANVFILYWYTKSFQEELAAILAKVKMVLCCSKSTRPTTDKGEQMALTSSRSRQSMSQTTNSIIVDSPKGSYH